MYIHEPLRVQSAKKVCRKDIIIGNQLSQNFNADKHLSRLVQQKPCRTGKNHFLIKEMIHVVEGDKEHKRLLSSLVKHCHSTVLITRHPLERLNSLFNLFNGKELPMRIDIINNEHKSLSKLKEVLNPSLIDTSQLHSDLHINPKSFFHHVCKELKNVNLIDGPSTLNLKNRVDFELLAADEWSSNNSVHDTFHPNPRKKSVAAFDKLTKQQSDLLKGIYTDIKRLRNN